MKKRAMQTGLLSLAGVGMLVMVLGGCSNAGSEILETAPVVRPVKIMQLTHADAGQSLLFPATARARREAKCSFRVSGPLVRFDLETGQKVTKGQSIAEIDSRDFIVAIKTLEAELAASGAALEEATLQYERYKSLYFEDAVAQAQHDRTKAAFRMFEARVKANEKNLEKARNALADTQLIAPFTGYVHDVFVENHETVSVGDPIVSIVDLSAMEMVLGLPEDLLGRVPQFREYRVSFDAVPEKEFTAILKEVGKKPDPASHAYPLTLILSKDDTSPMVRPGMAADVTVMVSAPGDDMRFVIPVQALFNHNSQASCIWVFDPDDGVVRHQSVDTGKLTTQGVEIMGALSTGQWIVTAGVHHLQEGQKVRILEKPSASNVGGML